MLFLCVYPQVSSLFRVSTFFDIDDKSQQPTEPTTYSCKSNLGANADISIGSKPVDGENSLQSEAVAPSVINEPLSPSGVPKARPLGRKASLVSTRF